MISRLNLPALILLIGLCSPLALHAQGSTGLSFLKIGVGGRNIAMGDAAVAGGTNAEAAYYNPALIAASRSASVTIMHNKWFGDITTQYLGAAVPLEGWSFGVFVGLTSVPEIEIRTVPGEAEDTFDSHNFAAGFTAAMPLGEDVEIGITAKYVFEKILVHSADGYAFDLGIRAQPFEGEILSRVVLGAAVSNLGSMSELHDESSKLPALARYGAAYSIPVQVTKGNLNIEVNGMTLFDNSKTHISIAGEIDYSRLLFIRAGYQSGFDVKDFTAGVGVAYSAVRFDYGYTPFKELGSAHTVSLSIIF